MEHVKIIRDLGGFAAIIAYDSINKSTDLELNIVHKIIGGQKETTNNIMEMTAILKALKYVLQILKKDKNKAILEDVKTEKLNIYVHSDSEYTLKGLTVWSENWVKKDFKNVKNVELWKELLKIKTELIEKMNINLEFVKVKGHSGDKYNELVDKLASDEALKQ